MTPLPTAISVVELAPTRHTSHTGAAVREAESAYPMLAGMALLVVMLMVFAGMAGQAIDSGCQALAESLNSWAAGMQALLAGLVGR